MRLTFELDKNSLRPVVLFENGMSALLDTGALFPVWVGDEKLLDFWGATKVSEKISFSGFGGQATGSLYHLKNFRFGQLNYPSLHIVACDTLGEQPYYMILSATMFSGLTYEINDINHTLTITIPDNQSLNRKVAIEDRNGKIHILTGNAETEQPA